MTEAPERARDLDRTVNDVLRLARSGHTPLGPLATEPLGPLADGIEQRWHGLFAKDGRRVDFDLDPQTRDLRVPGRVVGQILDILLDNARSHGRGSTTVTARDLGDAVALDVTDEGTLHTDQATMFSRGHTTGSGTGIGLALATDLAHSSGGRLALTDTDPTTFTLLLPLRRDEDVEDPA
ncbi:sensor histidine kinase [Embleya sp. NPDC059237]|uniref:sensor histidine kinase n=1 Tax=Embleya sp. NPDC059237 TaxID=3346784 RepID=UPI0036CCB038